LIWQLTPDVANSSTVDETEDGEAVTTTATTGQPEIGGRDPRRRRETTTDEKTDTRPHVMTVATTDEITADTASTVTGETTEAASTATGEMTGAALTETDATTGAASTETDAMTGAALIEIGETTGAASTATGVMTAPVSIATDAMNEEASIATGAMTGAAAALTDMNGAADTIESRRKETLPARGRSYIWPSDQWQPEKKNEKPRQLHTRLLSLVGPDR